MQNIEVLAHIHRYGLIPGLQPQHFLRAMEDLLTDAMLTENIRIFEGN
jgi:indolepyruvate ferredoxin oxidoreductase beta subunit